MSTTEIPVTLQDAAVRFLRRFGLGAAAWTALLAVSERGDVDRPEVLWVVVGVVTAFVVLRKITS